MSVDLFAHILVREVVAHGLPQAMILAQIRFKIGPGDGWYTPPPKRTETDGSKTSELQRLTGMSSPQIRRAVAKLVESGALETCALNASSWDQTLSYRPLEQTVEPPVSRDDDSAHLPDSADDDSVPSRDDDSGTSSVLEETTKQLPSPTPPEEGAQPQLFGAANAGAATRAEKSNKRDREAAQLEGSFAPLWKLYPNDSPKGGGGKGDRRAARRSMAKTIKRDQVTTGDLRERIENLAAARAAYFESWGVRAPLMNASTFFNGKHQMFDHPWDSDELAYWPAPAGRDWAKPRRRSVEEILAAESGGG